MIDDRLSIYEIEAMERQINFLNEISKDTQTYSSVTLGLPRVGYYLHVLKPYSEGFLSPEHTLEWFNAVDKRHDTITDAIKNRLPEDLKVSITSPLDQIDETIRSIVKDEKQIELDPILDVLAARDPLWRQVLAVKRPTDLYQLKGDFAEAVEEIRLPSKTTRSIIKSPKEEGTFELSSKISSAIGATATVVAMYTFPQIVTTTPSVGLYQMPHMPSPVDARLIKDQYGHQKASS